MRGKGNTFLGNFTLCSNGLLQQRQRLGYFDAVGFLSPVVPDSLVGVSVVLFFLEQLMCPVLLLESASIVLLLFGLDRAPSFAGRTVWDDDSGGITCCNKMAKADLFSKTI